MIPRYRPSSLQAGEAEAGWNRGGSGSPEGLGNHVPKNMTAVTQNPEAKRWWINAAIP